MLKVFKKINNLKLFFTTKNFRFKTNFLKRLILILKTFILLLNLTNCLTQADKNINIKIFKTIYTSNNN